MNDSLREACEYILHWQASGVEPAGAVDFAALTLDALRSQQLTGTDIPTSGPASPDLERIKSAALEWDRRGYETGDLGSDDVLSLVHEIERLRAALRKIADDASYADSVAAGCLGEIAERALAAKEGGE